MTTVRTCLWYERDGEAAARFYTTLLPGSTIDHVQRAPAAWPGGAAGDVILVDFTLAGQRFQALNGGTRVDYATAASISVECPTQLAVDRLWAALIEGGGTEIVCGWLRDRWGVPWQIVPAVMPRLLADPNPQVAARAFAAMTTMVKLDGPAIERAARHGGETPR